MEKISEVSFFDKEQGNDAIVKRLLRAMVLNDSFVYVVGGMSDTAGHGNMFADSYPQVMADIMAPAMAKAKIKFEVRNLAMGGVPSYPGSMCMKDAFGPDADVVMWDFRMVEHASLNGEIYIRQALMHPRRPFVAFKRPNGYLNSMKNYFTPASLHVVDERDLAKLASSNSNTTARDLVENDNFCGFSDPVRKKDGTWQECECPGQVRWHAGYKLQRLRGVQMALVYLNMLDLAVDKYVEMINGPGDEPGESPSDIMQRRWEIGHNKQIDLAEHAPYSKDCRGIFCSRAYSCAMSWEPRMGPGLTDIFDSETKWKLDYPDARSKSASEDGHSKCSYKDAKKTVIGGVSDGWVFFKFVAEDDSKKGSVAFCADFPGEDLGGKWEDKTLVLLNGAHLYGRRGVPMPMPTPMPSTSAPSSR
mmetsp:Transcript_15026/g.39466  ORF Transcript_15026/g.39466 Transcript_15026/m.39466 type:complete len:418 (+) Transcript_15026:566-1819(+)